MKYYIESTGYHATGYETPDVIITPGFDDIKDLVIYAKGHNLRIGKNYCVIKEYKEYINDPEILKLFDCDSKKEQKQEKRLCDLRNGDLIYYNKYPFDSNLIQASIKKIDYDFDFLWFLTTDDFLLCIPTKAREFYKYEKNGFLITTSLINLK